MCDQRQFLTWLAILFAAVLIFGAGCRTPGCTRPATKATPPTSAPEVLGDCPSDYAPETEDVCENLFYESPSEPRVDRRARKLTPCARCPSACWDRRDGLFCVRSCTDTRCQLEVPDAQP